MVTMTRKHFKVIAESLRTYRQKIDFNDLAFRDLVNDVMLSLEEFNPNFDRSRFLSAVYD